MDIGSTIRTGISLATILGVYWFGIGGRRGLRNPVIGVSFAIALLAGLTILIGHFIAPHPDRNGVEWLPIAATVVLVVACLCALLTSFLARQAVGDLLGRAKPDAEGPMDAFESDAIGAELGRDRLLDLLQLVRTTRAVPGYHWLTPEWVEARIERLPVNAIE